MRAGSATPATARKGPSAVGAESRQVRSPRAAAACRRPLSPRLDASLPPASAAARPDHPVSPLPPCCLQVRAVVVCRPPVANDSRRLTVGGGGDGNAPLAEIEVAAPEDVPAVAPDASLLRDIALGKDLLRLPLYGHRGADSTQLCEHEVAPLLQRLLAGESAAVIAYGQTGAVRCDGPLLALCPGDPRCCCAWRPHRTLVHALHGKGNTVQPPCTSCACNPSLDAWPACRQWEELHDGQRKV